MFKETVYHGTIQQKADAIVKEGFIESSKDIEWLGTGIYFFAKREDAELWAENEAAKKKNKVTKPCLLQANIFCNDDEFLDLDIEENMVEMERTILPFLETGEEGHPVINGDNSGVKLRCLACNFYKKLKGIKILAYSFPKRIMVNKLGFRVCLKQRQYAVSSNKNIGEVKKVSIGGSRNEKQ